MPELRARALSDKELSDLNLIAEIRSLYARMKLHLEQAEQTQNWVALKSLHAEARLDLELLGRLTGALTGGRGVQVNVGVAMPAPESSIEEDVNLFAEASEVLASCLEGSHPDLQATAGELPPPPQESAR